MCSAMKARLQKAPEPTRWVLLGEKNLLAAVHVARTHLLGIEMSKHLKKVRRSLSGEWRQEHSLNQDRYQVGGDCGDPSGTLPLDHRANIGGAPGTGMDIMSPATCRASGMEGIPTSGKPAPNGPGYSGGLQADGDRGQPNMGLASPTVLLQCRGREGLFAILACPVDGDKCRLVDGAGRSLRTNTMVPRTDLERHAGVGVNADSIRMARSLMSLSLSVQGLNDLQILQRSQRWVSPKQCNHSLALVAYKCRMT
ncbi:hypothetical protein UY3_00813 [Chelonia mydas]|uniref:Uncharacterized protein n=1 Tax=Chelonia mydas TaxID=8469 RepID=M7CLC1_CHEMY|nr:hypothetical protein UY3_00813 [Chelonia mydas]